MKTTLRLFLCLMTLGLCLGFTAWATAVDGETGTCNHQWEKTSFTGATCQKDGQVVYQCSVCGNSYTEVTLKTDHKEGNPAVETEATCTTPGSAVYSCELCGTFLRNETIPISNHAAGEPVTVDATCTKDGSITVSCLTCSIVLSSEVIPASHSWTITTDETPSCTKDGLLEYTCATCKSTKTRVLAATGHTRADDNATECATCGITLTPCVGEHTWGDAVTHTPPTCTENGFGIKTCLLCGKTEKEIIIASHTSDKNNPNVCLHCGKDLTVNNCNHVLENSTLVKDATCTEPGESTAYCSLCKSTITQKHPPQGHRMGCDSNYKSCVRCGATGVTGESVHLHSGAYEHDDKQHWQQCICGEEKLEYAEHIYSDARCICGATEILIDCEEIGNKHNWGKTEIVFAPTCTTDGTSVTPCLSCTAKRIETLPASHTPATDNESVCSVCGADMACNHPNYIAGSDGKDCLQVCANCGIERPNSRTLHTITCTNAVSCARCGSTDLGETFFEHANGKQMHNDTQHYIYCSACGKDDGYFAHKISCKTPGMCVDCKATGVSGAPSHNWNYEFSYKDTCHWYECIDCGAHSEEQEHRKLCTTSGDICYNCQASGVTCVVEHDWDWPNYTSTPGSETHWIPCKQGHLDAKMNESKHRVSCANPTTCETCGAENVTGFSDHVMGEASWQSNNTHCWYICSVCGEEANRASHGRNCEDTACWQCGRTDVTFSDDAISHSANITTIWYYDDMHHWKNCIFCGKPVWRYEEHKPDEKGNCECGKTGLGSSGPCSHEWKQANSTAPTCTQDGITTMVCTLCDTQKVTATPATGHKWNNSTTAATCTTPGSSKEVCSNCGTTRNAESTPALGHSEMTSSTAATCTAPGSEVTSCTRCGATLSSSSTPALGHSETTSTTAATCTAPGSEVTSCTRCGATLSSSSTPALGHSETTSTTAATCTAPGSEVTSCATCGIVLSSVELPMTGHNRVYSTVSAATCTSDGIRQWRCSNCGMDMERETIPAKGHSLSTKDTGTAIVESCSRCSYEKVTAKATATPAPTATPKPTTAAPAPTVEPTAEPTVEPTAVPTPTIAPAKLPENVVVKPVVNVVVKVEMPEPKVEDLPEDNDTSVDKSDTDTTPEQQPEEKPVVETIQIAVEEVQLAETPVVLPLPVNIEPTKVITVQVILPEAPKVEDTTETAPAAAPAEPAMPTKVTIALPVTEAEVATFADTKLVLVLEDGSLLEIPYEIIDGQLIFTTTQMGVFAFIPVE